MDGSPFQAKAAALGYAYQFRYALLVAIRKNQDGPDWRLTIEGADDIECEGTADSQLMQLKHRGPGSVLTNASSDLWKTLRIWSDLYLSEGADEIYHRRLLLITTGDVKPDSAPYLLAVTAAAERDTNRAAGILEKVAENSESVANKVAYEAFLRLSSEERRDLLAFIDVVPRSHNIVELGRDLQKISSIAVRRELGVPFLERLEGWWFRRCLQQLALPAGEPIEGTEFDEFFCDLRDQFRPGALPIDSDILQSEGSLEDFEHYLFVNQLKLLMLTNRRILIAIQDYFRAFTQRSRWTRESLLYVGEVGTYERRLREEWNIHFARMCEEIGDEATENAKTTAAREIYKWAEGANFPIRRDCTERFVTAGSFHMLSDELRVGWHPDFEARLVSILEPASGPK